MLYTKKVIFTNFIERIKILNLILWFQRKLFRRCYIRVINYHDTPKKFEYNFNQQLIFYKRNFYPVDLNNLEDLINGKWEKEKPGLIISFDDGLQSNYTIATPLLEKYGFTGWFFIPVGLIGTGQCKDFHHTGNEDCSYMSWNEIAELNKNHIIGCHTLTHCRLFSSLSEGKLKQEIINSKEILENKLNSKNDIFCWVGGEEETYTATAAKYIREAGYKYSFMTNNKMIFPGENRFQFQRTNIEVDWPLSLVKFYLSGIMDIIYTGKRNRVNKITG